MFLKEAKNKGIPDCIWLLCLPWTFSVGLWHNCDLELQHRQPKDNTDKTHTTVRLSQPLIFLGACDTSLQMNSQPVRFMAVYLGCTGCWSVLAALWNSFLTCFFFFLFHFPFIGYIFKWFRLAGLFLLVDLELLQHFHVYPTSRGCRTWLTITESNISGLSAYISVYDDVFCILLLHVWRLNIQFLPSVQKHL